jgi:hypothetical protein
MTREEFEKYFEDCNDDYLKIEELTISLQTSRPDLCAFLLLDRLCPASTDMVTSAGHDVIYLDIDIDELLAVATDEDIKNLSRCGVHYEEESLALYV